MKPAVKYKSLRDKWRADDAEDEALWQRRRGRVGYFIQETETATRAAAERASTALSGRERAAARRAAERTVAVAARVAERPPHPSAAERAAIRRAAAERALEAVSISCAARRSFCYGGKGTSGEVLAASAAIVISELVKPADPVFRRKHAKRKRARSEQYREKRRSRGQRRRFRLTDATSPGVSVAEWLWIVSEHGNACVYCCATDRKLTRDHLVPLALGGLDEPTNVVPACLKCNCSKGAKPLHVWLKQRAA